MREASRKRMLRDGAGSETCPFAATLELPRRPALSTAALTRSCRSSRSTCAPPRSRRAGAGTPHPAPRSAVVVLGLLTFPAAPTGRQPIAVVVEHHGPVAVGAAVPTFAGLLAYVTGSHGRSIRAGCDSFDGHGRRQASHDAIRGARTPALRQSGHTRLGCRPRWSDDT